MGDLVHACCLFLKIKGLLPVAYPEIFFGCVCVCVCVCVQQIQLRTEARENGDLGVVAP